MQRVNLRQCHANLIFLTTVPSLGFPSQATWHRCTGYLRSAPVNARKVRVRVRLNFQTLAIPRYTNAHPHGNYLAPWRPPPFLVELRPPTVVGEWWCWSGWWKTVFAFIGACLHLAPTKLPRGWVRVTVSVYVRLQTHKSTHSYEVCRFHLGCFTVDDV